MPDICSIISTPLFSGLWKICIVSTLIFEKKKNEEMPYFEPFLEKFGEMYSADSPFGPFIAFRVNGRYCTFLHPPTPNCFSASEISWNANVTWTLGGNTDHEHISWDLYNCPILDPNSFRQIYLVERICICICIWINVFVFVFVFESNLSKIFVFVFEKSKFLYLYLYLYLIKRIWPQPWIRDMYCIVTFVSRYESYCETPVSLHPVFETQPKKL